MLIFDMQALTELVPNNFLSGHGSGAIAGTMVGYIGKPTALVSSQASISLTIDFNSR
jgi:hypothetical protein